MTSPGRQKLSFATTVAAIALLPLLLTACGPNKEQQARTAARNQAAEIATSLKDASKSMDGAEADIRSFLVGDPNARLCFIQKEMDTYNHTFDLMNKKIATEINASEALAADFKVDPRFKTPDEQIAHGSLFLKMVNDTVMLAKNAGDMLRQSTANRDDFKNDADMAWYKILKRSDAATPWYNLQRLKSADAATAAEPRMKEILANVDFAKRLHAKIDAGWQAAQQGKLYDCSNWAFEVTRMKKLANDVDQEVGAIEHDWKPPQTAAPQTTNQPSSRSPSDTPQALPDLTDPDQAASQATAPDDLVPADTGGSDDVPANN